MGKVWDKLLGWAILLFFLLGLLYLSIAMISITIKSGVILDFLAINKLAYTAITSSGLAVTIGLTFDYLKKRRKAEINQDYIIRSIIFEMERITSENVGISELEKFYSKDVKAAAGLTNQKAYKKVLEFHSLMKNGDLDKKQLESIKKNLEKFLL